MRVKMWYKGKGTPIEIGQEQVEQMKKKGWKTTENKRGKQV